MTDDVPRLKGYRFDKLLGSGGMGSVHLAWDETLGRQVAVKALDARFEKGSDAEARFLREARVMATIEHPNVVRIYSFATQDEQAFIVMEYVEGETLADRLASQGKLPAGEALWIARQVAEALEAAGERGIVHRDIKPSNILIDRRGRVRVADFGLAKPLRESALDALTVAGAFQGTPFYVAPEQARGDEVDWRSDVYSLGVVLYEMLTGKRPFTGALVEVLSRHLNEPFPPIEVPELSEGVVKLVGWLSRKDPDERPGSYEELLTAIDLLMEAGSATHVSRPTPVSRSSLDTISKVLFPKPKPRRRWVPALAAVFVALVALGVVWRAGNPRSGSATVVRRSVAVLGFANLSQRPEDEWLSVAFSEMLLAELAAGGKLRAVAGENVARAKLDLGLEAGSTLAPDTLRKLRSALGADLLISGSYLAAAPHDQLRLVLSIQDAEAGDTVATISENGSTDDVLQVVSRAGAKVRQELGLEAAAGLEASGLPRDREALRHYSEGLELARTFQLQEARDAFTAALAIEPENPLAHAALAEVWSSLGYDAQARDEAHRAFELSADLSREDQLFVEGRYHEMADEFDQAIRAYQALFDFVPDHVDYGLRLAEALRLAGRNTKALEVLETLKKLPSPASDDVRILLAEGQTAEALSDFPRSLELGQEAVAAGEKQGARILVAQGHLLRGYALLRLGRHQEAADAVALARRKFAEAGHRHGEAHALNRIGNIAYDAGDYLAAEEIFREVLDRWREVGNLKGLGVALNNVANALMMQGDLRAARPFIEESLDVTRRGGNQADEGIQLVNLADVDFRQGELAAARANAEEGLRLTRDSHYGYGTYTALQILGEVLFESGDLDAAARTLDEGLELSHSLGDRRYEALTLSVLGRVALERDQLEVARQRFEAALAIREALGSETETAQSRVDLAGLAIAAGSVDEARLGALRDAVETFRRKHLVEQEAATWTVLARASLALGRDDEARGAASTARGLLTQSQTVPVRLEAFVRAARCEAAVADLESTLAEARRRGFVLIEHRARLALLEIGLDRRDDARDRLAADARARGLLLLARQAGSV